MDGWIKSWALWLFSSMLQAANTSLDSAEARLLAVRNSVEAGDLRIDALEKQSLNRAKNYIR